MSDKPYKFDVNGRTVGIRSRGRAVMTVPLLNRGTAFTHAERDALAIGGLLPDHVSTMAGQVQRVYAQYQRQPTDLDKHVYLGNLRDRNEVLFYRLLNEHIEEMLPIVYTPTIGSAIERFSHEFRRPRGVYLSVNRPEEIERWLRNSKLGADDVDLIVATDGEGILGIGDWGVGGAQIAIGKLAVYTAAAGIAPHRVLPVMLDTGTDNAALLEDDFYLGIRQPRVRGERYDEFIEAFVAAAGRVFPHAMLHWEDLAAGNARRVLLTYRDRCCTFNDDMQGTAAVVLAAVLAALDTSGTRMRDHRVVVHGAGTAGIGIADMLRDAMIAEGMDPAEATAQFWALGSRGLLTDDQAGAIRDYQLPYARPAAEVKGWTTDGSVPRLADVVREVRPTMLIGTSAQPGAFTEQIVRSMDGERPIILPLSNPTSKCEAHPESLLRWTDGRALIATGSPFSPVAVGERRVPIAQANNALIFPGLGLGTIVARASRVSDGMLLASARALAALDRGADYADSLLPPVTDLRAVSAAVAVAVVEAAQAEGLARAQVPDPARAVAEAMWQPDYPAITVLD
ncbi:MAG TPA: NAD-dependent malic enzyme [Sporichthyaceae bacterium]|jgi:malate dehydrogenase (oxaloacetate-decarboxylating)